MAYFNTTAGVVPTGYGPRYVRVPNSRLLFRRGSLLPLLLIDDDPQSVRGTHFTARECPVHGQSKIVQIAKSDLGVQSELLEKDNPKRYIGGRQVPSRPKNLLLPRFTDGPTPSVNDDTIILNFTTDKKTVALIFLGLEKSSGSLRRNFNPNEKAPALPPEIGPPFGGWIKGAEKYRYNWNWGGYELAVEEKIVDTEHQIEVAGLITGKTYNAMVCIVDENGNGPTCSKNLSIILPAI